MLSLAEIRWQVGAEGWAGLGKFGEWPMMSKMRPEARARHKLGTHGINPREIH
jgi:hypothetical protein